jgi:N-acetyl-1-D-myo-inositol-2-amino-2-deoxy-alpha-D-glucopyranoside deacetylase
MSAEHRLLLVHAHPDDESINNAASMARYVSEGARVVLVTCTLGELGEILEPRYAGLASDRGDQLGGYRISELATAMNILGVTDHRFLGGAGRWRDSGMMATAGNDDPRAFWHCASDPIAFAEAVGSLVEVIREVRPQVLVTYNDNGGYGHPDHIMAHRVAMAAVIESAGPDGMGVPWSVAKVYHNAIPRSTLQRIIDAALAAGDPSPFGVERAEDLGFGDDESTTTTRIDARKWTGRKLDALRAHRTQIDDDAPFFKAGDYGDKLVMGVEYYRLAAGRLGAARDDDGFEDDLFAGVSDG